MSHSSWLPQPFEFWDISPSVKPLIFIKEYHQNNLPRCPKLCICVFRKHQSYVTNVTDVYVCVRRMITSVEYWHKRELESFVHYHTVGSCSLMVVRPLTGGNTVQVAAVCVAFPRELTFGTHFTHLPRASWKLFKLENALSCQEDQRSPEYCIVILDGIVFIIAFVKINLAHVH